MKDRVSVLSLYSEQQSTSGQSLPAYVDPTTLTMMEMTGTGVKVTLCAEFGNQVITQVNFLRVWGCKSVLASQTL